ncbi:MAG: family 10 glycosylhydrolase [Bacteroidales bacterium]|nr:family 10 glycosylhydrolase [Candidatus Cryptobacteroides aphodequi]
MKHAILVLMASAALACSCASTQESRNYMWFDCEANYKTLSCPDSIRFYLEKVKSIGFGNVIVDMKSIMGEVLYDSGIAPYMSPFDGIERERSYDMMRYFLDYGHEMGLNVLASLNVFCGGHNYMDRGIIYTDHSDWQSICYEKGEMVPISRIKTNYNGMLNPSDPEVQDYQLAILKEFVSKYPDLDGIIFDRVRYDGMTSDFSPLSRAQFEQRLGHAVENWPEDVLSWYDENGELRSEWARGKYFRQWCEWRAGVIHDFIERTHRELKAINPNLQIGDYTGAWYPTYYQVGVNWASSSYDPSEDFDWATPGYKDTGYADLLDIYMTGLYYSYITKDDIDNALGIKGQSSEAGLKLDLTYCYCIEGGAELAKKVTCGAVPVTGSIYVEQYIGKMDKFAPAVEQALKSTGGVMVFDIVHLGKHHLWDDLEKAMKTTK